jgi:hypothetical protein
MEVMGVHFRFRSLSSDPRNGTVVTLVTCAFVTINLHRLRTRRKRVRTIIRKLLKAFISDEGGFTRSEAPHSQVLSPVPKRLELSKFYIKCDVNDQSLI